MPGIPFTGLLEEFTATPERSGATVLIIGERKRPCMLRVSANGSTDCIVYLWTITPGGGPPGTRPAGERRIQITNATSFPLSPGVRTIVGGWSEDLGVWAFWDARRHTRFSVRSPSLQTTLDMLEAAGHEGISTHVRPTAEGQEVVVSVSPDFLLWYVQEGQPLHDLDQEASEVHNLISALPEEEAELVQSSSDPEQLTRRVQMIEIMRAFRDARFRPMVLQAYSNRCAICSIALKLVDAAHIVPVYHPQGTDDVTNGMALCRLHHAAYDTGLIGVRPDYRIILNSAAAERLRKVHLDSGLREFQLALPEQITVPAEIEVRPDPKKLKIGMEIRQFPTLLTA